MNLVLVEKLKNGEVTQTLLSEAQNLQVNSNASYSVFDQATMQPPEGITLKRKGATLEIEVEQEVAVRLEGFYAEGSQAAYSVDGSTSEAMMINASNATASAGEAFDGVVWQASAGSMQASGILLAAQAAGLGVLAFDNIDNENNHKVIEVEPPIVSINALSIPNSAMKVGDVVTVTLSVTDDGGNSYSNVSGTLGGYALTNLTRINNTTYSAQFTVTEGGDDLAASAAIPVSVTLEDSAGNTSAAFTTAISQEGDAIDANSPSVSSAPTLDPSADTGVSNTDKITFDTTPTFNGTAEANATIEVFSGSTSLGTTTADDSGNWGFAADTLAEGAHDITATVTDAAGNVSAPSTPLTIHIDTAAPDAPEALNLDASSDTGTSSTDNITNDTTPTFNGIAAVNAIVQISSSADGVLGTTTADDSGNWSFTADTLTQGTHNITATATDAAGNTSSASSALAITIDGTAPAAPSAPDLADSSDTGASNTDNLTSDTTPTFNGTAEADATVELFSGMTSLGTATADGSGNWSFTADTLTQGTHNITARATDAAGNTSNASSTLALTIGNTAPAVPSAPNLADSSDTGASNTDNTTSDTTPTFNGTADTNVTIELFSGMTSLGTATADGSGNWSFTADTLTQGTHNITARATDAAGNTSSASSMLAITIDSTAPAAPSAPDLATSSDLGVSSTDDLTSDTTPTFNGTADANATIELFAGTTSLGTTTADGSGNWSFTAGTLGSGVHSIAATATDAAGNSSSASSALDITIEDSSPSVTITDDTAGTASGDVTYTFTFNEDVSGFTSADITVTGGSKGTFTPVSGSVYTLVVTPDASSTTDITVDVAADVAADTAGNNNTVATQSVQPVDTVAPTVAITDNAAGTASGDVLYTFTFSEDVTGFDSGDINVTGGTKSTFTATSASVYTLVVTPDAGSTTDITVDVAADVAADTAGNNNTAATQSVQPVDTVAPSVTITDDTAGTASGDVTYTFTFSEDVIGFDSGDINVTGGTKGTFTATSASVYTLVVTPDAGSTTDITVDVAADVAADTAGNNNIAATQSVQAVDTVAPSVTITDDTAGTANSDVTYTFTFNEDVSGFTSADITVTGGSKGTFTPVSGSVYTLVVTPDASSTTDITVDVAADVATDAAGNNNTIATQSVQAVNTVAPTVAITDNTAGTASGDVTYTFTFNVDVTGFDSGDITVTGGSKGTFTPVSGSVYTLVVTPDASSTTDITVDVAAGVAVDAASNGNTAATQSVQAVDTVAPTVAITDNTAGTASGDVLYTFTFSEDVTGFDIGDITVTGGTKGTFTATSGSVYTLVVTPTASSTTNITVDVAAGVAVDAVSNNNTAATQSVQAVDTVAPTVAITDNTAGTASGDVLYTFTFSEDVTGFDIGDITVTGGTKGTFTATSGSVYTLVVTPDANSTTDITVDVAADAAIDAVGNGNIAATQSVQAVDTAGPVISAVSIPDVQMNVGDTVSVTLTVADDGGDTYTNLSGNVGGFTLSNLTRTNSTTYTAQFTVTEGGTDVAAGANIPVSVTIDDSAGNTSATFNTAIIQTSDAIDANSPSISGVAIPDSAMNVGDTVSVTLTVADDGGDTYTNLSGNVGGFTLSNLTRTNSTTYTAQFTVTEGGTDVAAGANIPVSVTIEDSAGNTSATFNTAIIQASDAIDANSPSISGVAIPDSAMNVGDTVSVTLTVADDGGDIYTNLSGNVGGFTLSNLTRTNSTTYTAQFTVTEGGTDVAAGANIPVSVTIEDSAGNTSATFNTAIIQASDAIDANSPSISGVAIPDSAMNVGDTVSVTLTVADDGGDTYTNLSGNVGGFTLSNLTRTNSTTYTAQFTVTEGGTDVAAGANIPVSVTIDDSAGNTSATFNTAIIQASDAIDANSPSISGVAIPDSAMNVGDTVSVTLTVADDGGDTYTNLSGNVGGFTLSNLVRTNSTTYTAQFTVTEGGTDVAAGANIPVSVTIDDSAGNTSATFTTAISQAGDTIDANSPTLTNSSPSDNAASVALDANIVLTFNEDIVLGTGNIVISDGSQTITIDVNSHAGQLAISGGQLTINPAANLTNNSANYNVQIDSTAIVDNVGNAYAGIADSTTLDFTTEAALDTSIVVFDMIAGTSSEHSARTFSAGVSYDIYIKVDSDSFAISQSSPWFGASNLGSDDTILLVGDGAFILGENNGPINSVNATFGSFTYYTSGLDFAFYIAQTGFVQRATLVGTNVASIYVAGLHGRSIGVVAPLTALPTSIAATQVLS